MPKVGEKHPNHWSRGPNRDAIIAKMRDGRCARPFLPEEMKRKISASLAGRTPKNLEQIQAIRRGTRRVLECAGCHQPFYPANYQNTAQYCSRECRKKYYVYPWTGKPQPNRRGANHHNWRGGITPENMLIRNSIETKNWRRAVFDRDDYTCQQCGKRGGHLHAHHIKPFAQYPELRFDVANGTTLCVPCHRQTDSYSRPKMKAAAT